MQKGFARTRTIGVEPVGMKCVPDILWSPSYKSDSSVAVDQVLGGVVSVSDEILEPANKPMVGIILSNKVLYSTTGYNT